MNNTLLLQQFDLLATAPGGVAQLRELILTLAVQGKLVPQDPADEPASALLKRIRAEKDRLIAAGKIKRDKPLAAIEDDEKPFGLPLGWEWVKCGDYFLELCTGPFGSMIHQEDYVTGGVPLINPSHMISGRIAHDPRVAISQKDAERLSAYALCAGDMVLARRGEVGRYALVTDQEHGWLCGTGSFFVRLHRAYDRDYLGLVFTDGRFREHLQGESVGSTMTNLNQRILLDALIALPPLPEQTRIVARVEELMRVCDALEATGQRQAAHHRQLVQTLLGDLTADSRTPWQRMATHFDTLLDRPSAVDALEQTILQLAVRGQLVPQDPTDESASQLLKRIRAEKDRLIAEGKIKRDKPLAPIEEDEQPFELPVGWEWVRCGDYFLELCTGPFGSMIHQEDYVTGGVPLINPSHMIGGRVAHDPRVAISQKDAERLSAYSLSAGDMVLARRGEVGRYALVTDKEHGWLCGTGSFFVRLHRACDRNYLGLVFTDGRFRQHLQGESVGSTMTNLNQRILLDAMIALPPLPEQARIVARVVQLRSLCADLRQRLTQSRTAQTALAKACVENAVASSLLSED
jgi:type I restriction enzyme, S subunit